MPAGGFGSGFDRAFVDLFVIGIEVAVARLNGARPPEPTDIPLRAEFPPKASNICRNMLFGPRPLLGSI